MSMSAYSCYDYTIDEEKLADLSDKIKGLLEKLHEKYDDEQINDIGIEEGSYPEAEKIIHEIIEEVYNVTGLKIRLGYHGEGDRADDLEPDHYYWYVDESQLWKPTELCKKYFIDGDLICKSYFVEVG